MGKRTKASLVLALLLVSLSVAYLTAYKSIVIGLVFLALISILPFLLKSVQSLTFGFFVLLYYSFSLFFIGRLLPIKLPMGLGVELLLILLFSGILISGRKIEWSHFKNTTTFLLLISTLFGLLQFFNPNALSLEPWFLSTRVLVFNLILYFITVTVLNSGNIIKRFSKIWLALSLITAFYGIYQEIFGYSEFEWHSIYNSPGTIDLILNGAILRKFSFLSDVAAFGMLMAFSSIFTIVLAFGPFSIKRRLFMILCAVVFLMGMSYSGTRTATAMVPFGLLMYGLLSITRKATVLMGVLTVCAFLIFLYGPFYSATATRVRSTFKPSNDPSLGIREINRAKIQPYLRAHPFGGGVYTTGGEGEMNSPGHPLAGFPSDSGYLKTGLEIGWIGLIIELLLYLVVLKAGVINYYRVKNQTLKILYAAYISSFFALCIANFTQNNTLTQKPQIIIVFAIFTIMPNMIKFDSN
jgi:O-Antigen ligase